MDPISSEPYEEREDDMCSLDAGFVEWMRKRAASAQRETTFGFEGPDAKIPKRSDPNGEVQKSLAMINVVSLERVLDALPALEGAAQGVTEEACASLEDRISAEGPLSIDNVLAEAPSIETAIVIPLLFARQFNLAIGCPHRLRGLDRLVLNSPVKPMKWGASANAFASGCYWPVNHQLLEPLQLRRCFFR